MPVQITISTSPALHESGLTLYILVLNAANNLVGVLKFLWNTELAVVANSTQYTELVVVGYRLT